VKPDCMFLTSSITQVSQTSRPMTPETAAILPEARRSHSQRLISFTGFAATAASCLVETPTDGATTAQI